MKSFLLCLTLCVCSAVFAGAWSTEEIEQFYSSAAVKEDSSVTVTETLVVRADGDKIRRGIFRVLPYRGVSGYQIVSVSRDGKPEPYSVKSSPSGKTVYIGDANRILPPGRYIYKLSYTVTGAVRFQKNFDEFYWNVTGNDWQFPIDAAYFQLSLPAGAKVVPGGVSFYTGLAGAQDQNARELKELFFGTTRPLDSGEGLTVSVAWNKGVVQKPPFWDSFFSRRGAFFIFAWVFLLIYYVVVWRWVGKDPEARVLRRFTPPEGLSPAQVSYLYSMGNNSRIFSVIIMSLLQKGFISVVKEETGKFTLVRTDAKNKEVLSDEEWSCLLPLFGGKTERPVDESSARFFKSARQSVYFALGRWDKGQFFSHNFKTNIPTLLFAVALLLFLGISFKIMIAGFFGILVYIGFAEICFPRFAKRGLWLGLAAALCLLLGAGKGLLAVIALAPGVVFFYLVRAYTVLGRRKMDEVEGFLQYLETAEANRVFASNPTDAALIYCDYLPYAVALGIENKWWNALESSLGAAAAEQSVKELGIGVGAGAEWTRFSSALRISSASGSSSSKSSSSSGFGGGGCSGGGSGGGGGGGW